jgi:hypothetical protein
MKRAIHICFGGPEYIMDTPKGPVRFEMHPYCGPLPCDFSGSSRRVGVRHPFWALVSRWAQNGQIVRHGKCVVPPDCSACGGTGLGEHLDGRNYKPCLVCNGEGWSKMSAGAAQVCQ